MSDPSVAGTGTSGSPRFRHDSPRITDLQRPAKLFLTGDMGRFLGDGTFNQRTWIMSFGNYTSWDGNVDGNTSNVQPALRHMSRTANIGFVDGHGERRDWDYMINPETAHDLWAYSEPINR